jgi:hypothetical protein
LAQDSSKGQVSPYYQFIVASCPGKNLEVMLKSGQKLSGRCHTPLADHFEITHKGVSTTFLTSVSQRSMSGNVGLAAEGCCGVPYVFVKMAIGIEELYKF